MKRLDVYLFESDAVSSRQKAKKLICEGKVSVNGKTVLKPSYGVSPDDSIAVLPHDEYVGRGAYKLIKAFDVFSLDVKDKVCADMGASTGGFTQVLLEKGAKYVYAVDVGHNQLAKLLQDDGRVENCEGVNIRYLTPDFFSRRVEFMCCDLSFISLRQTVPSMEAALCENGELVALIKPQFEAGKSALGKNGLVKDPKKHIEVLYSLCEFFAATSLSMTGLDYSPICGGDGNIEYLTHLVKNNLPPKDFDIKETVSSAFENVGHW